MRNQRSTTALSVGVYGRAGWIEMAIRAQTLRTSREMNTLPWSTTIVSGKIGGTPASGVPCSSVICVTSTTTCAGSPWKRQAARSVQPLRIGFGRTQS